MDRDHHLLLSIVETAALIDKSLVGHDEASFVATLNERDAVAYRLLAIGEMARKLSADLKARHPTLAWMRLVGMRNLLAHEYPVVDFHIIWAAAVHRLPELVAVCRAELDSRPPF